MADITPEQVEAIEKGIDFALRRLNYTEDQGWKSPKTIIYTGFISSQRPEEVEEKDYYRFSAGCYGEEEDGDLKIHISVPGTQLMYSFMFAPNMPDSVQKYGMSLEEALTHVAAHETTHHVQYERGILSLRELIRENIPRDEKYNLDPIELQANLVGSSAVRDIYGTSPSLLGNWTNLQVNNREIDVLEEIIDMSIDDINILENHLVVEEDRELNSGAIVTLTPSMPKVLGVEHYKDPILHQLGTEIKLLEQQLEMAGLPGVVI